MVAADEKKAGLVLRQSGVVADLQGQNATIFQAAPDRSQAGQPGEAGGQIGKRRLQLAVGMVGTVGAARSFGSAAQAGRERALPVRRPRSRLQPGAIGRSHRLRYKGSLPTRRGCPGRAGAASPEVPAGSGCPRTRLRLPGAAAGTKIVEAAKKARARRGLIRMACPQRRADSPMATFRTVSPAPLPLSRPASTPRSRRSPFHSSPVPSVRSR